MDIHISGLSKKYGRSVRALTDIYLDLGSGMYGLLGPNGAGKTTFMRILVGIVRPSSGRVEIGGENVTKEPGKTRVRRNLGYLPQDFGYYPDLTARQFLDYMGVLKQLDDPRARRRQVDEVLDMVGLTDAADRPLKGFSGGMRQRVGIGQALLGNPELLIVDEPTVGLDPEERIRFRNLLAELASDRLVILSTHIVEDVSQTCPRIGVLKSGSLLFDGEPTALIRGTHGHVWETDVPDGERAPDGRNGTVVSTLRLGDAVRYRTVSETAPAPGSEAVQPTLEDAYIYLMKGALP